jgi:hypothetical protein
MSGPYSSWHCSDPLDVAGDRDLGEAEALVERPGRGVEGALARAEFDDLAGECLHHLERVQAELTAHLTTPVRLGYREQVDPPVIAPLGDVPGNERRDRPIDLGDRDPSSGRGIVQGG